MSGAYPLAVVSMQWLALMVLCTVLLAWSPDPAEASGRRGGHWGRGFGGSRHHHGNHGHHHHGRFGHRPIFPAFVAPSVVVSSPVVVAPVTVYTPPPAYALPPVYSAPSTWAPPPAYAASPPPAPRVLVYPGGRYELRGDGVTSPYVWVWIPDPPAAPPVPPPPPAPPSGSPEPSFSLRTPAARTMAYRWTDDAGVTTWTDSLDKVPERFRAQAARSVIP